MNQYVVWVEFGVAREHRTSFSQLVRANAVASLRNEAGCRRFDVLTSASGDGSDVALYEVYDSEAAFVSTSRAITIANLPLRRRK